MPIPFIVGAIAVGVAAKGIKDVKDTKDSLKAAQYVQKQNIARFEEHKRSTEQNVKDLENMFYSVEKLIKEDLSQILAKLQNLTKFDDFENDLA